MDGEDEEKFCAPRILAAAMFCGGLGASGSDAGVRFSCLVVAAAAGLPPVLEDDIMLLV